VVEAIRMSVIDLAEKQSVMHNSLKNILKQEPIIKINQKKLKTSGKNLL
jgi:hypothetical protein